MTERRLATDGVTAFASPDTAPLAGTLVRHYGGFVPAVRRSDDWDNMPDTASLVSAIAAVIAASLAGANLYLNGRREDRRWARETLVELFASYLDASFRWSGTVATEGRHPILEDVAAERRQQADQAHHDQTAILTRLRLLAPKPVVDAAIGLHGAGHELADLSKRVPLPTADEFLACNKVLWTARLALIAEAKKTLGLDPSITDVVHSPTT